MLVKVPASCEHCPAIFEQMGLVLITRGLFIFLYSLYTNMAAEYYPVMVRSIAFTAIGFVFALGYIVAELFFTAE